MDKKQQEILKIIENYLKGNGSRSSMARFAELFRGNKNETLLKSRMKADWDAVSDEELQKTDLSPVLYKIHFLINSEKKGKHSRNTTRKILRWYSRIAAVILLPLLTIWGIYQFTSKDQTVSSTLVEVSAPLGSRVRMTLPDGTKGWLNSGSVLTYQTPFKKRNVSVEGEAFFDVQTDSLCPFLVQGPRSTVKVLGTRFNVKMWPGEEVTEVVLEEGKVELTPGKSDRSFTVEPGEMLVYNSKERKLKRSRVNPEYYSAWIEGKLVLRGDSMQEMARELSRWFNVDVEVRDSTLQGYTFRATFMDEKLEDVLRLLKMTSPIEYKIIDNQKDKNGDFSRKKVIIFHR